MNFRHLRPLPLALALAAGTVLPASALAAPALRLLPATSQDLVASQLATPTAKRMGVATL
ncbi:MAG: hypothetical protein IT477_01805, partial [Rhodanobacteraceae bacterium]|nr:hypothetical protein [Rhodanobacteraceae bacterium]